MLFFVLATIDKGSLLLTWITSEIMTFLTKKLTIYELYLFIKFFFFTFEIAFNDIKPLTYDRRKNRKK
jgi:hypothetical protein